MKSCTALACNPRCWEERKIIGKGLCVVGPPSDLGVDLGDWETSKTNQVSKTGDL